MTFREHLEAVCHSVDGAIACTLMGVDGIEVDTHLQAGAVFDTKSLLVEFSGVFRSARDAAEAHEAGGVSELAISTDKVTAVARLVTPEYYLVMALSPGGNLGKARYVLRVTAPLLRSEL